MAEAARTRDRAGAGPGSRLRAWAHRLEEERRLDAAGGVLARTGERLGALPTLGGALRGEWLGHALHPLLTDFPLGAWMSASLLDLWGGDDTKVASQRLIEFGVLAALPTAITGLVEAGTADSRGRRVAAVHACVNGTALALYTASLLARRRDRRSAATLLGVAGGVVATVGGYLGGHLSLVLAVGVEQKN